MGNYFTSFRLLAQLGKRNIHATGYLNKKKLAKCDITSDKQLKKKAKNKKQRQTNFPNQSQLFYGMIIVLST